METVGIISLLPIIVALILSFWTKDALLSLLVGCLIGVVIQNQSIDIFRGLSLLLQDALGNADFIWVLAIEVFIGILVAFFMKSGAIQAFVDWINGKKLSKRGTEIMAYLLGIFIFFSDYFSPLYVGNVMRPLTDNAKTSREYLAFVCDCTSAPICCLIPFTSWGVYVAGLVVGVGAIADATMGQAAVVGAFKFNFYCWAILIINGLLAVGIIPHFGPMKKAQKRALETGQVYAEGSNPLLSGELDMIKPNEGIKPNLFLDFVMPAIIIIGVTVGTYIVLGSARTLEAFICAVIYQFVVMWITKKAKVKEMMDTAVLGIKAVMAAILILAMAYCINSITKGLGAPAYLISVTEAWMTPFWLLTILLPYRFILGNICYHASYLLTSGIQPHRRRDGNSSIRCYRCSNGRRLLRRPLLSDFRYDHSFVSGCRLRPHRPRKDTDALRYLCRCNRLHRIHDHGCNSLIDPIHQNYLLIL